MKMRRIVNRMYDKAFFRVDRSDLMQSLTEIGIKTGDNLLVHSSLSSIGYVVGGARTVILALIAAIGSSGTLVMPTFPQRAMKKYLDSYERFSVASTPSRNGIITELFRTDFAEYRSIHPTHPVAAFGPLSEEITRFHHQSQSPFDQCSPFAKMLEKDFSVLLIGVTFEHLTACRVPEDLHPDLFPQPYLEVPYSVVVHGMKNEQIVVTTRCHDPKWSRLRNNTAYERLLGKHLIESRMGKARIKKVSMKRLYDCQMESIKIGVMPYQNQVFE